MHLLQWVAMRRQTFKTNLAKATTIKLSTGKKAKALIDGKYKTYWTTASTKDTTAEIVFTFKKPQNFNVLSLQENIGIGQRIENFEAEYWDGSQWLLFTKGTTVGYKRLLQFDAVKTSQVRLKILSSRLNPTLSEVGFYYRDFEK